MTVPGDADLLSCERFHNITYINIRRQLAGLRKTMSRPRPISESTIARLSRYSRFLNQLDRENHETVSSKQLAEHEGLTPAQVRKDLSFFGSFGTRGLGYPVRSLKDKIARILGVDQEWHVALVGIGNIGSALVSYKEFARFGFKIVLLFDNDQRKIGSNHKGIVIKDVANITRELKANHIEIVVLAVPAQNAQKVVDDIVKAGVKAILNFAPTKLRVPRGVIVRDENMAMEMEYLSFRLANPNIPVAGSQDSA